MGQLIEENKNVLSNYILLSKGVKNNENMKVSTY